MTLVTERPRHGEPRPYHFPAFRRDRLANGLDVISVDLPERELVTALLLAPVGAADERGDEGGRLPHGPGDDRGRPPDPLL
jgi:predicted Zn-dependent peptidase